MTTFETDCTLPTREVTYVTGPNTRGTLQILWSCLSILVLCTYTVLHLNVPPQDRKSGFIRTLSRFSTKLVWTTFTILAPEYILGKAYSDRVSAKKHVAEYVKFKKEDGVDWTISHTWLANMGGFMITFDLVRPAADAVDSRSQQDDLEKSGPAYSTVEGEKVNARDQEDESRESRVPSAALKSEKMKTRPHEDASQESRPANNAVEALCEGPAAPSDPLVDSDGSLTAQSGLDISKQVHAVTQMENTAEAAEHSECSVKQSVRIYPGDIGDANVSRKERVDFTAKHNIWKHAEPSNEETVGDSRGQMAQRVRALMENAQVDTFQTDWEKAHFSRNWRYWCSNMQVLESDVWVLDACQLLLARKMGIINSLPYLTEDQLADRNKGDLLVKTVAIGQCVWLTIQLIARAVFSLATSQLEIVTLSFALCTLVTYTLQWNKPKDIHTTVTVPAHRLPTDTEIARIAINGPTVWGRQRSSQWMPNNSCHCNGKAPDQNNVRMWDIASYGAGVLGAVNGIAYFFHFPTPIEKTLWRVASFATLYPLSIGMVLNSLMTLALLIGGFSETRKGQRFRSRFARAISYVAIIPYTFARVYITFEMFRCLCFAPPETFRSTWAVNVPHIG